MAQYQNLIFIVAIIAAFWFLIFRPQQQRQKQHAELMGKLEPGMEIVTIGGIYATIVEVGEDRILVEVADGGQLEISKRAVGQVVPPRDEDDEDVDVEDVEDEAAEDPAVAGEAAADEQAGEEGDAADE